MQKNRDRQTRCVIAIFLLSCWIGSVFAQQIPHLIKYQGSLPKQAGGPSGNPPGQGGTPPGKGGTPPGQENQPKIYTLTFRIYNLETGGAPLWKETHPKVIVEKQGFEVLLGSITPLDLNFNDDYWLSIEIDSQGEINPRERMNSIGYAYMADDAWKLGGRYSEEYALMEHSHLGEDIVTAVPEAINADMVDGLHADQIGGVKDHSLLEGLADDDHLQYLNILRGDERYAGTGWDGLTRLKTAQDHIADKNNPHTVTLEQLGYLDNNLEEEAPTVTERGEPTGTEIQQWADDIISWGHSSLVANLNADMVDGFHTTDSSNPLPNTLLALGADGKFPASVIPPSLTTELWTDAGQYIYPNNAGNGLQILDEGHLMLVGNAGIIDAETANPKGTLTVGQSLTGNNVDYSLVISRHGTPPNPGIYSHTAPALLIQDFSGTVPSSGRDKDGLLRINAYRIGDATPNAANVTLLNVNNDEGEALRVDGLRNTFIGYGQKYPTSNQIGSLFVDGRVGIGTTEPRNLMQLKRFQPAETIVEVTNDHPSAIVGVSVSREGWAQSGFLQYYGPSQSGGLGSELLQGDSVVIGSATGVTNGIRIIAANNGTHNAPIIFATGLWYAAAAERMRITSSGNVGIRTSNPQNTVHLKGGLGLQNSDPPGSGQNPGGSWNIGIDADGRFLLNANTPAPGGDSRMIIDDNSGYVGIGVNPSERLHVDGYVKAQGYKTGDIIFEKDGQSLWRMFEDEDGLYLENTKTGKVYRFVLQEVVGE